VIETTLYNSTTAATIQYNSFYNYNYNDYFYYYYYYCSPHPTPPLPDSTVGANTKVLLPLPVQRESSA
jgi:hypothetical protein